MDKLKCLRISCRGYRSHTTKLLSGIQELIIMEPSSVNAEAISNIELTLDQLQWKHMILEELDTKIAPLIREESELEEEIMETEDTRGKILHSITHLKVKLTSISTTAPDPVPRTTPRSQPPMTFLAQIHY